jgi:hypothetical protein
VLRCPRSRLDAAVGAGQVEGTLQSLVDSGAIEAFRCDGGQVLIWADEAMVDASLLFGGLVDKVEVPFGEADPVRRVAPSPTEPVRVPKALAKRWARKLEQDGFEDVESANRTLKPEPFASHPHRDSAVLADMQQVAAYFDRATKWKASGSFWRLPPETRKVWSLHCEGTSIRETVVRLGVSFRRVRTMLSRCRRAAGLPEVTRFVAKRATS